MASLALAGGARAQKGPTTRAAVISIADTTVTFEMVRVPGGKVLLEDEAGKKQEREIKPFWIGKTEVTWDEFDVFYHGLDLHKLPREQWMKKQEELDALLGPSRRAFWNMDRGWGHSGWPAGSLTARAAREYCKWLSKKTGKKFRLPTDAEWDYACRAGGPPVRLEAADLKKVAWFLDNSEERTHEVKTKQPNPWGLYDMLGNVSEWVMRENEADRVAGGSFIDEAKDVHSGAREPFSPEWQQSDPRLPKHRTWMTDGAQVGFRVVMEEAGEGKVPDGSGALK